MSKKKKFLIILLIILVVIQFFRPTRNEGIADGPNSMIVPENVKTILQTSCYVCHSNHTEYPWYTNVQPVGWWMTNHVNEAKREINFSEFNTYKLKRKIKKMKEIREQLEEDEMPLSSYTLIHGNAKLSSEQRDILLKWADSTKSYLTDTLVH